MPALRLPSLVGFLIASEVFAHGGGYVPPQPVPVPAPGPSTGPGPTDPTGPAPGGQYRGPRDTTPSGPSSPGPAGPSAPAPSSPSSGGPSTGGPSGPSASPSGPSTGGASGPSSPPGSGGARAPTTGGARGLPLEHDFNTWDYWWEFNKNRFLMLRDVETRTVQTGSDDFYLGATRSKNTGDVLRPTAEQTVHVVLPALKRAIDATTNRDIATACIVAMAKIGSDHPEFQLVDVFVPRLRVGDQEVRETAALALGLMSRNDTRSLPLLEGLALDAAAGRSAYGGAVDNRTRSFATYGLGLTAHGASDVACKQRVFAILRQLVEGERVDRNVKVAAITSLGLLAPSVRSYDGRKLRDEALAVLGSWFERDLGVGDELVQAHCPTAIAKLLARGDAAGARWCERFAAALVADKSRRRSHAIAQSCALALGQLAEPAPDASSPDHCGALLEASRSHPDALTRYFALIALGQIGGQDNCSALLKELNRAGAGLRRPWCALALGLLLHGERERQVRAERAPEPDPFVVAALHDALRDAKEPGLVGALGIALGLCGARQAAPMMRERMLDGVAKEQMAGYLCIGLALMQEKDAVEDIRKVMVNAARRSELLVQAAIALGRLGDREAAELMVERMTGGQANLVQLAAFATALSQIGERRSIEPLVRMLHDDQAGSLARAFAAAALGGISDWRRLPWNTPIGADINYRASVETLTNQQTGILDIL